MGRDDCEVGNWGRFGNQYGRALATILLQCMGLFSYFRFFPPPPLGDNRVYRLSRRCARRSASEEIKPGRTLTYGDSYRLSQSQTRAAKADG